MRIAFEVNGVLRDTIKKLESTYEKLMIEELELGEEEVSDDFKYEIVRPINTEIIKDHFKFKSDEELKDLYSGAGVDLSRDTIAYCRIGERSAFSWFVLHELLGVSNVKNYDGSWTEYGSLVGVPVAVGA